MGGKKKKSAAAPTSVQPAAAAAAAENATNAATESAGKKQQQRPNNDKSTMKENKPRELEKKVIKLINEYRQEHADKGPISGRLTSKKLLDLYTALQKFQFKTEHIEEAMKSSMLYGGDLTSALDWLCLNLRDDELPEGFSQKMLEEKQKSRPKFQPPKEDEKQTVTKKETSVKDNGESMKEWILRYAEQSEDQSSEEDENKDASVFNPELDEKFDPNDRYLLLAAQLYDAKEMAAESKAKKDKAGQRTAQDRIRVIQQEMKSLESHPMFNSAVKVKDAPKEEKKPVALTDGKEELNFNLFEQADTPPAEKEKKKKEPKDIRNFDYTSRSWTGKSPKQFLIDWCRKNLPKSPPPSFGKVAVSRYWKCKVRIQRPNDVLEVCPTILTEDGMQAQHLGATLALYNLVKGQSVHQLLPPTYRDVWLEWQDGDQKEEEQTRSAINKPRDQFIARLLARLKQQQTPQPQAEPQDRLQDAEAEDSWENLDTQEDHEPQRGGGLEAEEASRRLLLKLRSSALARRLLAEREQLPVFQHRQQVLEALRRHRVLVIAGETGSGKSTQIPQFILEELLANGEAAQPCNVVVTQPRRISAMSLASRVSLCGKTYTFSLCGYQIRMENRSGDATRLLYCTTGVLLRKLQQDRLLSSLTHIIVDEVHERSVQSDFLLTVLKEVVHKRSDLRLILMSATVDCQKFANYFNRCPVVTIPGRTFPVEVFHLEDIVEETGYVLEQDSEYSQRFVEEEEEVSINITQKGGKTLQDSDPGWDLSPELDHFSSRTRHVLQYMNPNKINMDLILDLLEYLDKSPQFRDVDGAVLIFLPGLAHIQQLYDLLTTDKRFSSKDRYKLIALHSTLSSQDHKLHTTLPISAVCNMYILFSHLHLLLKIVLSTNIAETGVTIPDVVFVIDTGKTKENRYHESSQMSSLVETFVSKASALQRQGRAGRTNIINSDLYMFYIFESFIDYSIPEILRVPLEELCLHIMLSTNFKCEYGSPEDFLCRALDAPQQQAVCNAVSLLRKIGACQQDSYALTPLGHHLAALPVNVKIGKMLIFGAIFSCLEPIATIAAAMSEKSPFVTPMSRKEEANLAKSALAVANSDHMTIYSAYLGWKSSRSEGTRAEMAYCRRHFLSRTALMTIEDVKHELIRMVEQAGFVASKPGRTPRSRPGAEPKALGSLSQQDVSVLKAVLTAGLYDSVGRILCSPSLDVQERVVCVAETAQGKAHVHPSSVNRFLQTHGWLLFQEKVKYTKVFLRDTTLISPLSMLLFGGDIDVQHRERLISLDGWIYFQAPVRIGVIFKHLRKLIDSLLERKLANPKMNLEDEKTIQIITELIKSENML
uniref:ATP-dependent RNA helicase DHX29 n=1 Tax=Sinocyclocheilus anshuiensis TaxID=1608454 RepID=A0A671T8A6_9TELE